MAKITAIVAQKNNSKRFSIFIDGVFSFGADEDLMVDYRLIIGKEVLAEDIDKMIFESEVGKLMKRIYNLLSIRLRSENEIRRYIKNLSYKRKLKGSSLISDTAVNLLIEKLNKKGLINDLQFAKSWVDSRRKNKKRGIKALRAELFLKGIDREVIKQVLDEDLMGQSEEQLADEALIKKLKLWKNLSKLEFKKKAYSYLARNGFDFSIISAVVEKQLKKV